MTRKRIISQAPGRINIIGEHTDYNEGYVLPAAINKKTVFELILNGTENTARFFARNINTEFSFDLLSFNPIKRGWENYVMGVVAELQKLGASIKGFDAHFEGNVPIGSGMSSSASLECSLAVGLNKLFDLGLSKLQLIKACQMAEHTFVGTNCGIMDQFTSIMGKQNQLILLDCRSLEFEYVPFELGDYQILLLDSNVSHTLANSEYNARRSECAKGVLLIQNKFPKVKSLRDVTIKMLDSCFHDLTENIFKRCRHVILENERVIKAKDALKRKDFQSLGQLIYQSHNSLSNDYEVSCNELDFLVEITIDKDYILGNRMMGGGFGGCTLALISISETENFIELASRLYFEKYNIELIPYVVSIDNGAGIIEEESFKDYSRNGYEQMRDLQSRKKNAQGN